MATGGDIDLAVEDLTEEDLQDLHEDILDRNEEGVKGLLKEFFDQDLSIRRLCCTEVELEPATHDHILNWLPLTGLHRAALINSNGILSAILSSVPDVDINQRLKKNGFSALHVAASGGVLASVNYLTSSGASVNAQDEDGQTPMHLAALNGHNDVVSLLCVRGASVNITSKSGQTPLHLAAEAGHHATLEILLNKNGRIHIRDEQGYTALLLAQLQGHVRVTKCLLDRGSDVTTTDQNGNTTIQVWVQNMSSKNKKCRSDLANSSLSVLLNWSNDVNHQNNSGDTVLHQATQANQHDVIKMLISYRADVNIANKLKQTPIFYAKSNSVCHILIQNGAKCDVLDSHGSGVLHQYASSDDVTSSMISMVIAEGGNVNHQNIKGQTPLHCACLVSDMEKVSLLLDHGARNDLLDKDGHSILHMAMSKPHTKLTMWLLNKNSINVFHQDSEGKSLLHMAAMTGSTAIVQFLLSQNVDINSRTKSGNTATTLAAECGKSSVTKILLKNGGLLDTKQGQLVFLECVSENDQDIVQVLMDQIDWKSIRNKNGDSALHIALANNFTTLAELLVNRGASVNILSQRNQLPLHTACMNLPNMEHLLPHLVHKSTCCQQDYMGLSALHYGIAKCNLETVERFLKHKFAANSKDAEGRTVAHVLVQNLVENQQTIDACEKIKILLFTGGIDPDMKDNHEQSLLHTTVLGGDVEILQLLLDKGANVNTVNADMKTPLHLACARGTHNLVSLLLQHRADITKKDVSGWSPIFHAIKTGKSATVMLLLKNGAGLDVPDTSGQTCLMLAMSENKSELCTEILLEYSPDVTVRDQSGSTLLHYASRYCLPEVVELVLEHEPEINVRNMVQSAALHEAASNSDAQVLKVLLSHGAAINVENFNGNTPLHVCSERGSYDHVKILLDNKKVDVEIVNKDCQTALHLAAMAPDSDVMQLLVANEADIDVIDKAGNTPLMASIFKNCIENCSILLEQGADVSVQNSLGNTATHLAMEMTLLDKKFLKLLVHKARKCMHLKNRKGQTAVDVLISRGVEDLEAMAQELNIDL